MVWTGTGRRGQAALEYMVMISIALLLSTPLIIEAQSSVQDIQTTTKAVELQRSMDAIEEGARLVNSQGSPAKTTFRIKVPAGVTDTEVTGKRVFYQLQVPAGNQSFFRFFSFNVSGKLPASQGRHTMEITAVTEQGDTVVNISERE